MRNCESQAKDTDHSAALDVLNALALNPDCAFPLAGSGPVMRLEA